MTAFPARPLSAARLRTKVRAALSAAGLPLPQAGEDFADVPIALVRGLPPWAGRFGILGYREEFILWCRPRRGAGETFPSQFVLNVPPGRYILDALDLSANRWISRESAAGGPLVAGLPFVGGPVLVLVSPSGGRPKKPRSR